MIPLFARYPRLEHRLPYHALGSLPTPIEHLERLGKAIGAPSLYIKRDDLSGRRYGGNKVRKLEFVLAQARLSGAKEVLTFGYAGSNHALATALYARDLGLRSVALLLPQANARYLRRNLLAAHGCGAELHLHANLGLLGLALFYQLARHRLRRGAFPHLIAAGGSSALGTVGYVNAAFELKEQIAAGTLPEPDLIYLAAGSLGTAAGLALGLRAAGLRSRVVAVRVVAARFANADKMHALERKTRALLRALEPGFEAPTRSNVTLRHDCFGEGYARFSAAGQEAVNLIGAHEGLELDGAYTGKALAALVTDARKGVLERKVVLFWNTYNARPLDGAADYQELPRAFHRFFKAPLQALDGPLVDGPLAGSSGVRLS